MLFATCNNRKMAEIRFSFHFTVTIEFERNETKLRKKVKANCASQEEKQEWSGEKQVKLGFNIWVDFWHLDFWQNFWTLKFGKLQKNNSCLICESVNECKSTTAGLQQGTADRGTDKEGCWERTPIRSWLLHRRNLRLISRISMQRHRSWETSLYVELFCVNAYRQKLKER